MNPLEYFLLFLKASLFSSGGLSNLPSLHNDLLERGWATEADFGQSVALGQLSPGPNGLWVICLGYLTYGVLGSILALLAITIPPLLVLVVSAFFKRYEQKTWLKSALRGIQLATVGLVLVISWSIVTSLGIDWRNFVLGIAGFVMATSRRIPVLLILIVTAGMGYLIYS